jgi:hypothetical protein
LVPTVIKLYAFPSQALPCSGSTGVISALAIAKAPRGFIFDDAKVIHLQKNKEIFFLQVRKWCAG